MYSQLLSLSFDAAASPWINLKAVQPDENELAGWGFAWYPKDDAAAIVIKDPQPMRDNRLAELIGDWARFRSTVFVCHIRGAAKRVTQQDTHPFCRSFAGRSFVFAHSGDLVHEFKNALPLGAYPVFEPIGRTDSEWAFCWLLTQIREIGARRLGDVPWATLGDWLATINALGSADILLSDGVDLVAYRDRQGCSSLWWSRRSPPIGTSELGSDAFDLELSDAKDRNRTVVLVSTVPLDHSGWTAIEPGQLLIARRGEVVWQSSNNVGTPVSGPSSGSDGSSFAGMPTPVLGNALPLTGGAVSAPAFGTAMAGMATPAFPVTTPERASEAVLRVTHETYYAYQVPVERSSHVFRLAPVHDALQDVLDYELEIQPHAVARPYEDVFGNRVTGVDVSGPYSELRATARSRVRIRRAPDFTLAAVRATIPTVWMPWQRQMMVPFLLPPELPETQLRELSSYAMGFVERQDWDMVEALLDMNRTIHRDFQYLSGSTTLETTPWDVYVHRRGVCQDFANLFICLARLLDIPARYRVGYIRLDANTANWSQSAASHAWVEVYIPHLGWRGFDPTNGCLAELDHVRVAVGRNYRDATPTTGTIYRGGLGEFLSVNVQLEVEA